MISKRVYSKKQMITSALDKKIHKCKVILQNITLMIDDLEKFMTQEIAYAR